MQELTSILRDRRFWAALTGVGLVLGLAGPFGTVLTLGRTERLFYWMFMVYLTGPAGLVCSRFFRIHLTGLGVPTIPAGALAGAITGVPISLLVHGANALLLTPDDVAIDTLSLTLKLIGICIIISVAVTVALHRPPSPPAQPDAAPGTPPAALPRLLDRLPEDIRAPLIAIDATDHYTRVVTTKGSTLLLLRLSDAMAEAAPTPGMRIHRSHWIARDQITAARRESLRGFITSADGTERPVSRSYLAEVEGAGLLPKR
jgi:hypothetical protein